MRLDLGDRLGVGIDRRGGVGVLGSGAPLGAAFIALTTAGIALWLVVLIVGGPRINNAFAKELGYDAGFGPRTTPLEVASFLAQEVVRRAGKA